MVQQLDLEIPRGHSCTGVAVAHRRTLSHLPKVNNCIGRVSRSLYEPARGSVESVLLPKQEARHNGHWRFVIKPKKCCGKLWQRFSHALPNGKRVSVQGMSPVLLLLG